VLAVKRILLTNDDGIHAEGIRALGQELSRVAEVVVVAPDREQSATSHSLTLTRPLRMFEVEPNWYAVDGTPTDCVNLAVLWLLQSRPPDLVVSGINLGTNLGDDVTYSGTVSATFEAFLLGIPSVAISQEMGKEVSFERSAKIAASWISRLLEFEDLPREFLLNVNFPAGIPLGARVTRLGKRVYRQSVIEKEDPRGRKYYWIAGTPEWQDDPGTDHEAVRSGWVSLTPLHLDLTDYKNFELVQKLDLQVPTEICVRDR
jgi:5'-nucleotidase